MSLAALPANVRQSLTHAQRNDLQAWVAWRTHPRTWQAVITGMNSEEVDALIWRMGRAGVPTADLVKMAEEARNA